MLMGRVNGYGSILLNVFFMIIIKIEKCVFLLFFLFGSMVRYNLYLNWLMLKGVFIK